VAADASIASTARRASPLRVSRDEPRPGSHPGASRARRVILDERADAEYPAPSAAAPDRPDRFRSAAGRHPPGGAARQEPWPGPACSRVDRERRQENRRSNVGNHTSCSDHVGFAHGRVGPGSERGGDLQGLLNAIIRKTMSFNDL